MILETLSDQVIQTLGYATDITPQLAYNEVSTLEFSVPKEVDGVLVPNYDKLVGWNLITWKDLGRFILMDPSIEYSDGYEMKHCQAYSLEFEWVFKQFYLEEGVYNFWSPVSPEGTILGTIMDTVPHWSLGTVDSTLIGVYRSLEEQSGNLYDFVKSTLQESVGCIFEFDTLTRTVNVRDVSSRVKTQPIFLSKKNLLKEITVEEDSQNIITCADVNGAEGVTIIGVNPTGGNKLYNLDYFIDSGHFSGTIAQKWESWQTMLDNYQQYYYNVTIERDLQRARWLVENAKMIKLNEDLDGLEQQQTAVIQSDDSNEMKNSQLASLNSQIAAKKQEIEVQQAAVDEAAEAADELDAQLNEIQDELAFSNTFTDEEWGQIQKYIKEDTIEETTFVYPTVKAYNTSDESYEIEDTLCKVGPEEGMPADSPGVTVTKIFNSYYPNKTLYSISGGHITMGNVSADIIKGSFERNQDGSFVTSYYLGKGTVGDNSFKSGCIALSGTCSSPIDDTVPDPDTPNSYATGTLLQFTIQSGFVYVTGNLTIYQEHSVEWDLMAWGEDTLAKLAYPTYTFSVDSANFLSLEDFDVFRENLELGTKCYLDLGQGQVLQPILIGVVCEYSDLSYLKLEFSSSYISSDPTFQMKDLLEQAVSMGKKVDYSKYTYSSFVSSGASTAVNDFINSALDVAKNNIMTATGQAITWNENGLRFRKWNTDRTDYEPEQMWAINNQLVFSDDGFDSVKTALGKIKVGDVWMYGIAAEAVLGRLIAGNNLYIEAEKTDDRGNSVFKVDGEGVSIHDAVLDVYNGANTHLSINPYFGIAIGSYPVYSESTNDEYVVDEDNAVFWVDLDGNLHIKGTLEVGSDGVFGGVVRATDFQLPNGTSMLNANKQWKPDYLDLKGLTIRNSANQITLQIDSHGNISMIGDITMTSGTITWSGVNSDPGIQNAIDKANSAQSTANSASSTASSANSTANSVRNNLRDLVNGDYSGGSFISGTTIYAPQLMMGSNGTIGEIYGGYGSAGNMDTDVIYIDSNKGIRLEARDGGIALNSDTGIWLEGGTTNVRDGMEVVGIANFRGIGRFFDGVAVNTGDLTVNDNFVITGTIHMRLGRNATGSWIYLGEYLSNLDSRIRALGG